MRYIFLIYISILPWRCLVKKSDTPNRNTISLLMQDQQIRKYSTESTNNFANPAIDLVPPGPPDPSSNTYRWSFVERITEIRSCHVWEHPIVGGFRGLSMAFENAGLETNRITVHIRSSRSPNHDDSRSSFVRWVKRPEKKEKREDKGIRLPVKLLQYAETGYCIPWLVTA